MKIKEIDLLGKLTPSFHELCVKHGVSYEYLISQLAKGIKIEQEHTGDIALAREIALDHLDELPNYYDKLEKIEKGT